jgi:hypothetical protein
MSNVGAVGLNVNNGKPSYVSVLSSDSNEWSATTSVTSVADAAAGISWTVSKAEANGKILVIKVKGTKDTDDDPPASGTVTVVTTSPACTVTTTAGYVNDPSV